MIGRGENLSRSVV